MRNLVKKAKSQMWMAYAGGILSGIFFCVMVYFLTSINYASMLDSKINIAIYWSTSFIIRDKIFEKVIKFQNFVRNYSTTHIAIMVEKAINSGDKEKAMILVDQYNVCKNKNKALLNYLDGIIEGKFSDTIKLELDEVKYDNNL